MPDIGYFHPQLVHFVIAGLGLGILFRWVSLTGRFPWTDRAATTLLLLGTIAAVLAAQSGTDAHGDVAGIPGAWDAVQSHEDSGNDLRNLFLAVAALEVAALVPALATWRRRLVMASAAACAWGAYDIYDAGRLGGELVYSYAGGVGERSGDSTDINNTVRAALYNRALLDRAQHNAAAAAQEFEELARRFPNDAELRLALVESALMDRKDAPAAFAALHQMAAPTGTTRFWIRYEVARSDAFALAGQADSARTILTALAVKFPNRLVRERLAKLQ